MVCQARVTALSALLRLTSAELGKIAKNPNLQASSASEILRYVRETDVSMVQKYIYLMGCPRVRLKPEKQTRRGLSGLP